MPNEGVYTALSKFSEDYLEEIDYGLLRFVGPKENQEPWGTKQVAERESEVIHVDFTP